MTWRSTTCKDMMVAFWTWKPRGVSETLSWTFCTNVPFLFVQQTLPTTVCTIYQLKIKDTSFQFMSYMSTAANAWWRTRLCATWRATSATSPAAASKRVTKTYALSLCHLSNPFRVNVWSFVIIFALLCLWNTPCWLSSNIILVLNPLLSIAIIYDIIHYFPSLRMQEIPIIMWFDHINIICESHQGYFSKGVKHLPQNLEMIRMKPLDVYEIYMNLYTSSNHPRFRWNS